LIGREKDGPPKESLCFWTLKGLCPLPRGQPGGAKGAEPSPLLARSRLRKKIKSFNF